MGNWSGHLLAFGLLLTTTIGTAPALADQPQTTQATTTPTTNTAPGRAVVVTLEGTIDDYTRDATIKRFAEARRLGADVVILKLHTPGGLVGPALDLSRFLKQQDDLHVIAFVHGEALSAGAMIAMACDEIVMAPSSFIGDCAPIVLGRSLGEAERAKAESPILAEFNDSAVKNGHDPVLAAAMVSYGRVVRWVEYAGADSEISDPKSQIGEAKAGDRRFVNDAQYAELTKQGWREVDTPGVPRPLDGGDSLLTVSADTAHKIGLASEVEPSTASLAAARGYTVVGELSGGGGEKLIEVLNSTVVRAILLIVFLLALYIGLHTPGAGGAEAVALISLGLLVGVPMLTGYAQWWEIVIIVVGLCLIALELFVIPGFGFTGIAGIAMVLGGLVMTFVGNATDVPGGWRMPQVWAGVQNGLLAVVSSFAISGLLAVWLRKYLPKLPYLNRLVLQPSPAGAPGTTTISVPTSSADAWPFVGTVGRAVSDLKPGGSAEFPYADDRRITAVVSDSGFVPAGTKLAVREVHGNRVVVRPIA